MHEGETSEEALRDFLETGSDIAGGATGALIGLGVGGPVGAVLGGAGGPVAARALLFLATEFKQRVLGKREEQRIGATIVFAGEKIRENKENGKGFRQDGFFEEQPHDRAAAEEIFEGVLLVAQREHQEKKLRFFGNLLANIAFHPEVSRGQANLLVRLGETLSYRQICLLALFVNKGIFDLRQRDYREESSLSLETIALLQEALDLYSRGMIAGGSAMFGPTDITPGAMDVQGMGAVLYDLMELREISLEDLDEIAPLLQ